jgi:hypothetical protein
MAAEPRNLRSQLMIEQHARLWERISQQHKLRWEWQKFGMLGTFGFYAVVFAKDLKLAPGLLPVALWLPVLLNVLGLVVSYGIRMSAAEMARAVGRIEESCGFDGWERSQAQRRKTEGWRALPITMSTFGFWIVMIVVTAYVAWRFG